MMSVDSCFFGSSGWPPPDMNSNYQLALPLEEYVQILAILVSLYVLLFWDLSSLVSCSRYDEPDWSLISARYLNPECGTNIALSKNVNEGQAVRYESPTSYVKDEADYTKVKFGDRGIIALGTSDSIQDKGGTAVLREFLCAIFLWYIVWLSHKATPKSCYQSRLFPACLCKEYISSPCLYGNNHCVSIPRILEEISFRNTAVFELLWCKYQTHLTWPWKTVEFSSVTAESLGSTTDTASHFQLDILMQQIFGWLCLCNAILYDYLGDSRRQLLSMETIKAVYVICLCPTKNKELKVVSVLKAFLCSPILVCCLMHTIWRNIVDPGTLVHIIKMSFHSKRTTAIAQLQDLVQIGQLPKNK